MPALSVTFTGDSKQLEASYAKVETLAGKTAAKLTAAMTAASNVMKRSGAETYATITKSISAIEFQVKAMEQAGLSATVYRDALVTLNNELHHLTVAEKLAGDASVASAEKRFAAAQRMSSPASFHDGDYIAKKAQYESMFAGNAHSYHDEAAIQKSAAAPGYMDWWIQNTAATPTAYQKQQAYLAKKVGIMGAGGMSGVAPGFSKLMATEAKMAETAIAGSVANSKRHITGLTGVIRESMVILREIMMGRGAGRIMGSVTLLEQYIASMAKISAASLATWGAAVAVVLFGAYEKIWGIKKLARELTFDLSAVDIGDTYIAKLDRHISNAKNAQRELNEEIRKTTEQYNSAAEAAKRISDITNQHFEHQRQMNRLSNAPESVKNQRELEINMAERAQQIANKEAEQAALKAESEKKYAEVRQRFSSLPTKQEDEDTQKKLDEKARAARDFLKNPESFWQKAQEAYMENVGGLLHRGEWVKYFDELKNRGAVGAQAAIDAANNFKDKSTQNDISRGLMNGDLEVAKKSASGAVAIGLDLPRMRAEAAQKNQDEAELNRAKMLSGGRGSMDLTANQRIGAFAMPQQTTMIDLTRKVVANGVEANKKLDELVKKTSGDTSGYRN